MSWAEWVRRESERIRGAGQWRAPRDLDGAGPEGKLAPDGRAVVQFASNDYLGLTQHPAVVAAAHAALDRWGAGSGAARLVVGSRPLHTELEAELATWKRTEAAVLFPTGFAANLGALTVLAGPGTLVCSDELNHASIIDGTRLSRAEVAIYPHRDLHALDRLLADRGRGRRALVVTDTVFSMDGDLADVDALVECCAKHDALLLVDEAHAVLGPEIEDDGVIRVGTLSKTLGALGGFVAGPRRFTDLVVNRARSYIFTTAPTPADTAAALAALRVVQSSEGEILKALLRANIELLAPGHPSPIVPVVCGEERRALEAAAALLERGILVPAIRPPTVEPGTSRLRVTLSAAHTPDQVRALCDALIEIGFPIEPAEHAGPGISP
ncbi:MAG: 8-amino-7-oxononanoate synthase [Actinobacteria bacterium]|nr:8-amino-7-oxononanoate synthase [Actinomycetota bacterium]